MTKQTIQSLIKSYKIYNLNNQKNIKINFKDKHLCLLSKAGGGKSVILNALKAILTNQNHYLVNYVFDKIEIEFYNDKKIVIDSSEIHNNYKDYCIALGLTFRKLAVCEPQEVWSFRSGLSNSSVLTKNTWYYSKEDVKLFLDKVNKYLKDSNTEVRVNDRSLSFFVEKKYRKPNSSCGSISLFKLIDLSDGEQKIVEIFGEIIFNKKTIIIMDDIEVHLNPDWQENIIKDIVSIPTVKFLLSSTHSPYIYDDADVSKQTAGISYYTVNSLEQMGNEND